MLRRYFRSERSQGMTEFALVAPILFLMIFGIVDFGRAIYFYVTISQAADEGARVAIRGEPPDYLQSTDGQVLTSIINHAVDAQLGDPCPNGPVPANPIPPVNHGFVYVTEYPAPNAYEAAPPPNAPGQGAGTLNGQPITIPAGCNPIHAASGNVPLQVTIFYNFQPITPLLQNVATNHIIISNYAVYRTEY